MKPLMTVTRLATPTLLPLLIAATASAAEPSAGCDVSPLPELCGKKSGLVPFHKDAIHSSLFWSGGKRQKCPKMIIWMRPSEYKPKDYVNPTVGGVFSGFNPNYLSLVQGGIGLTQLDESGWSRYAPDLDRENAQIIDVCGIQGLVDQGKFTKELITELNEDDLRMTDPFYEDAGFSRGLNYNLFCSGAVAGADGDLYAFSFHDKRGNNGGRKVNVFDTKKEAWRYRPITCVRQQWDEDPTGASPHCSALDESNTDPTLSSDMKYKRWYPTAVTLPDGRILVLSGSNTEEGAPVELIRQPVPEVYDPSTDTLIALENAQKLLPMYPRAFVVQTGKSKRDWKVCVVGEVESRAGGFYDPFLYNGKTSCLDVLAALADPNRDAPAESHWTLIDVAANPHDSGAGVMRVKINKDKSWSQQVWIFGGGDNINPPVATAERIDFAAETPKWERIDDLIRAATQNNAVILPDGRILIVGGATGRGRTPTLELQLYDLEGDRTTLVSSTVPRHDHSTALLMPNAGVWIMGGNRTDLLASNIRNQSVPVMEFYEPPYLFRGERPLIKRAPEKIRYGQKFELQLSSGHSQDEIQVGSVVIVRSGPVTHNWTWGNQFVELPFSKEKRGIAVKAPHLPGLAVPGDYLLFVVSKDGVPSEGTRVRLGGY